MIEQSLNEIIARHGVSVTYTKVQTSSYNPDTGTVDSTTSNFTLKSYPKQIRANAYNMPSLIGKEVIMFYFNAKALKAVTSLSLKDSITYNSKVYNIDSYSEHVYAGEVLLYNVVAVKG